MPSPIELHYWPTPNGWKIAIALEEMGLPYTVKLVNIRKGEQFAPEFLAISPNNRMPAIVDPDAAGGPLSIFESGAILQYLGRKSGKFYGADERSRTRVDQWVFWQAANLGPASGQAGFFKAKAKTLPDPSVAEPAVRRFTNEVDRLWGVMERQFTNHAFIAGPDYSIADMACWPWLNGAYGRGELASFPRVKAWFETIQDRPAAQTGRALYQELRTSAPADDKAAQAILYGQTSQSVAAASKEQVKR
jgi:glutathione S-transferase